MSITAVEKVAKAFASNYDILDEPELLHHLSLLEMYHDGAESSAIQRPKHTVCASFDSNSNNTSRNAIKIAVGWLRQQGR